MKYLIHRKRVIVSIIAVIISVGCMTACSQKKENEIETQLTSETKTGVSIPFESDNLIEEHKDKDVQNSIILGLKDDTLVPTDVSEEEKIIDSINYKSQNEYALFCRDSFYDITYYVNLGEDNCIYRLKGDKEELVIPLSARRLICREGILYFILETYNQHAFEGLQEGNILSYHPITGEIKVVSKHQAVTMMVYEDGIYYYTDDMKWEVTGEHLISNPLYYFYSFETEQVTEIADNILLLTKWKEYFLTYELKQSSDNSDFYNINAVKFETIDKNKNIIVDQQNHAIYMHRVIGDKLYHLFSKGKIRIFDIITAEKEDINFSNDVHDFVIIKDLLFTDTLHVYNLNTGVESIMFADDLMEDYKIFEIYTDGENIYVLYGENSLGIEGANIKKVMIIGSDSLENAKKYKLIPIAE